MIITDLDGTLLNSNHELNLQDEETLKKLGKDGHVRVVATGRILYSAQTVMDEDFPIDYLVFASGAGILDFKKMELIYAKSMSEKNVLSITQILEKMKLNFMVHAPVPDNHYCLANLELAPLNEDFKRRHSIYEDFIEKWEGHLEHDEQWERTASLILTSVPTNMAEVIYNEIKSKVKDVHVVRTTSPLSDNYNWIEILPPQVSKATACQWLKDHLKLDTEVMAIGNDFNDLDMLNWANHSYVVSNAPDILKTSYENVSSNDEGGFTQAVNDYFSVKLK